MAEHPPRRDVSTLAHRAFAALTAYDYAIPALAIPDAALVGRMVPKKLLLEQGAAARGDKALIRDGLEGLDWVAALKPTNIGVPAFRSPEREYLEIAVLVARVRDGARAARLSELIHRAVPYPVLLFTEQSGGLEVSLAHKRDALNEAAKVVLEEELVRARIAPPARPDAEAERAYLAGLAIALQPRENLFGLYGSWLAQAEALAAARVSGRFTLAVSPEQAAARRAALAEHALLVTQLLELRATAKKEKQLARRAELNLAIQALEARRARAEAQL